MIFKRLDTKQDEINTLNTLLKNSKSEKQKALISRDLKSLKNGYESEKQNAYYIDFYLEDSKNVMVLHDIRIEHNGKSAQIDHILITRLGIELLESKSFVGELTINSDNSMGVKYKGKVNSFENPLEQSRRHAKLLKDYIDEYFDLGKRIKLLGGFPIDNIVLISPKTTITNKTLPDKFFRADSYIDARNKEIDNMGVVSAFKQAGTMIMIDTVKMLAKFISDSHTPIKFDYTAKYKVSKEKSISKKKPSDVVEVEDTKEVGQLKEGSPCPFCENPLVLRNAKKSTPFLGCSKYPRCRFTRRVSAEFVKQATTSK
jgi:Nuclease-related domain/Topoisomerase DNA binding C4 zinc finger